MTVGCKREFPECINTADANLVYAGHKTLYEEYSWEEVDTLEARAYNLGNSGVNIVDSFAPPYLDELDLEIRQTLFSEGKRHLDHGMTSLTDYSFSFKESSYTDENGGKWYDVWLVTIMEFAEVQDAVRTFNKMLGSTAFRDNDPIYYQGNDSMRFISGSTIVRVGGSCRTMWFVQHAADRLRRLYVGTAQPEPNTLIRTYCGGGSSVAR